MRKHRILKRVALMLGGLLAGVLFLETGLQVGALYVHLTGREAPASPVTENFRILCLGDSNTYGLWLDRDEAYPPQLEVLWNEAEGLPKSEVLNLGFPGTNSSRLLRDFPRMLETFRPNVVIIMIGANDFWTVPVPTNQRLNLGYRVKWFIANHSRVYKLLYMIRRQFDAAKLDVVLSDESSMELGKGTARFGDQEFEMGWQMDKRGAIRFETMKLEENIRSLAGQARSFGAKLILMTYPSRFFVYLHANKIIRRAGAATNTEVVDLEEVFKPLCPQKECPELLFEDHHPKAPGYRIVAETIVRTR